MQEILIGFLIVLLKLVAAIGLSAGALYSGMSLIDRLTSGIEEWKEIKKGNAAVGLLFLSVMVAIVLLMEIRISDVLFSIRADLGLLMAAKLLFFSIINYALGLLASVIIIFLTINTVDRITGDINEFSELKKGNLAVALILATSLILITLAARHPFESAFDIIIRMESAFL